MPSFVAQDGGDIAIIGLGCRFPGDAKSPGDFYEMLLKGRTGWSEVPKDRFNVDSFWHPSYERHGSIVCRGGHFLTEDVGLFDSPFFSMTQGEANAMDPQHRMLLEIAYESLENAGIPLSQVIGSETSCFVGGFTREYDSLTSEELADTLLYTTTGNGLTMMSNRLSWFYDLRGPSLSLDTACSSSLVALNLACQTIRSSSAKSRQALVAGANLILVPDQMTTMNPLHFLSPDSQCFSFDDRANGYTRGEGIGMLVLKHIDDAIRDNDCIRAVIRGTGVNQDGKTPGITLPSSEAQTSLIRATYEAAGLDTADTAYFEAHGTGTAAGDPLEVGAIASVFDRSKQTQPLYVGTVKPNIGHLEAGAGMAGMIKTVLALEAGVIPPNVNFLNPNPKLRLDEFNFKVPTQPTPWPTSGLRRASVNSFGYGGTNGHCILDDAYHYLEARNIYGRSRSVNEVPQLTPTSGSGDSGFVSSEDEGNDYFSKPATPAQKKLFVLSAPEQNALPRLGKSHADFLQDLMASKGARAIDILDDMAYTLGKRRSIFQWRSALVAGNVKELASELLNAPKPTRASKPPSMLFCFTGQGAQWYAMGRELMSHQVYAHSIKAADKYLKTIGAGWSLLEELAAPEETSQINKPQFSQPLCTAVQVALVDLLRHWNVTPTAVVGHSSGEIGAAYALGALSAEDCWKVSYHRGRLANELKIIAPHLDGAMMAVGLSEDDVKPYVARLTLTDSDVVQVACINSPASITISGDRKLLQDLERLFKADKVFARMLSVENAYHSAHMSHIANGYLKVISDIKTKPTSTEISMFSSVTGKPVSAEDLGPQYWIDNMCSPVQFVSAIDAAFQKIKGGGRRKGKLAAVDTIVELGPHSALQGPVKQTLATLNRAEDTAYFSALRRGQGAVDTALALAGALWSKGAAVDLALANSTQERPKDHIPLIDLPKYPWNHANRYWHESAGSKGHRFRSSPRTDLLGAPIKDFSMLEPTWKNVLRISELPWIADHKVRGSDVFPAAGMICAAIEGARAITDVSRPIVGYELRDIVIGRALIIPADDPGIHVYTTLKPRRNGVKGVLSPWFEYSFVSLEHTTGNERKFVEHSTGFISINYAAENQSDLEAKAETQRIKEKYHHLVEKCTTDVTKAEHYEATVAMGFEYGPTFQGLTHARTSLKGEAVFEITITDTKSQMPAEFEYDHLLHPSTLDNAIQASSQAIERDGGLVKQSMVPTGVEYMRVSAQMPKGANTELVGYATAIHIGYRDILSNMMVSVPGWSETVFEIHNIGFTGLGDNTEQLIDDDHEIALRKMCYKNVWKPDIDLLDTHKGEAQEICGRSVESPTEVTDVGAAGTKATAIYIKRALKALTSEKERSLTGHFKLYLDWMRHRNRMATDGKLDYQKTSGPSWLEMTPEDEDKFLAWYEETYPADGQIVNAVGRNLSGIIEGTIQPLTVMLENDMLTKIYAEGSPLKSGLGMFRDWFDLQGHKQPGMKILEIGAGTGSVTKPVLEILGGTGGRTPRFGSYCFTDISTGWFAKAQEIFKDWQGRLEYKKLNIEEDPLDQGFEPGSFDVVAASNVLHATKRLDVTLANCYKLLKPGGKIVIGELTHKIDSIGLAFGTLPGWWLSEDGREGGPLISPQEWDQRLKSAQYTGLDLSVGALNTYGVPMLSMMVSTKMTEADIVPLRKIIIVKPNDPGEVGDTLANQVADCFSDQGVESSVVDLTTAASMAGEGRLSEPGTGIVSLLEAEKPVFARCSEEVFESIRKLVLSGSRLFWITNSASSEGVRDSESCAISGLFRTAKSENPRLRLHELHLKKRTANEAASAVKIMNRVVSAAFAAKDDEVYEDEIVEAGGVLTVARLVDEEGLNSTLQNLGVTPSPEPQPLVQAHHPLKLTVGKPGQLDTLHFVDDAVPSLPLPENEVEVEVRADALNANDVLVAMGTLSDLMLGVDVAGVVKRVGAKVSRFKAGDRVVFPKPGGMATVVRVQDTMPQLLPDDMSFEDGVTIPVVFMAAYQSLIHTAHVEKGERVLIHAAAGGLGQAAIQIAKHLGAEIFVTVSTDAKRNLMTGYGIPEDHIFDSRSLSFGKGIKRMTEGKGVDVVLNTLAYEALRETWACISPFGRFIQLDRKDILANNGLDMKHFLSNVSFSSVNIQDLIRTCPDRAASLFERVFNLFRMGVLKVVHPVSVFDYSQMEEAFRTMQNGNHAGKIVLKVTNESTVPAFPHDTHPLELHSSATYILIGGLGGLGRGLAVYLADHGAKNIAFFSRTDELRPEAETLLADLRARNIKCPVYACDITNTSLLADTIAKITTTLPPIKGVIQGAMVLKDGLYENMPYENWIQATRPKIQGSWNLHETLPKDLDFFIMLSSVAGILGNRGQSNYCAGNTYQDGLAHYRNSLGLAARSIDLGAIGGIGWMEENKGSLNFAKTMENLIIKPEEFFTILKCAITGFSGGKGGGGGGKGDASLPTQLITGVGTGGLNKANLATGATIPYYWLDETARMRFLRELDLHSTSQSTSDGDTNELKGSLTACTTVTAAVELITGAVAHKLAKSMMVSVDEIDVARPVSSYGVDSLVAAEMRNWCFRELKADVNVFELLSGVPITGLAGMIAERSRLVGVGEGE